MKQTAKWTPFPHDGAGYDYPGAALKKNWDRLHLGDREPYPDPDHLERLIAANPGLEPDLPIKKAAGELQKAWRAYHGGDFATAAKLGLAVGPLGYNVANKASIIYASYLEEDPEDKLALLIGAARRAEEVQACAEALPNAWYFHAQALGRYGQELSIAKVLAEGLGDKVKTSLERAIALEPQHADARIALGAYNAVVIYKMGETIGRLTYGASRKGSLEHFRAALELNPDSAIGRIEYANGLVMLFGKDKLDEAIALYEEAAASAPADAMERLDVELAKAELEDE